MYTAFTMYIIKSIILGSRVALSLLLAQSPLHSITPARIVTLVTLPIAAMQGTEAIIPYSWVPLFPLGGERHSPG